MKGHRFFFTFFFLFFQYSDREKYNLKIKYKLTDKRSTESLNGTDFTESFRRTLCTGVVHSVTFGCGCFQF